MEFAGYTIQEKLYQGKRFSVYRAISKQTAAPCVLKVADKKNQPRSALEALDNEYRLLAQLDSEYVGKVIDRFEDQDACGIVLEDIRGRTLRDWLQKEKRLGRRQFFEVALAVTRGLAAIHQRQIIHKDLNPANILWLPETGQVQIIDFDLAANYDLKVAQAGNPERLEGTLPYLAPEQTGRMNRTVDQRSDLYALGVTLYELLTGRRPFESRDPLELVAAHLAQLPTPPLELIAGDWADDRGTGDPLWSPHAEGSPHAGEGDHRGSPLRGSPRHFISAIIMKLLAKNPEDRYQSAEGLLYDLEILQRQDLGSFPEPHPRPLPKRGGESVFPLSFGEGAGGEVSGSPQKTTLAGFTLGTKDFSGQLRIPEKLYGREAELDQLLRAYQRAAAGASVMILVAGYAGVGKTALVNELQTPIAKDRGYFISGKFEQLQRNVPYFAISQALGQFCELLLTEAPAALAGWRQTLQQAVGDLGKVLTDWLPGLAQIIGKQPNVPYIGGVEAKNRFNYVFQAFIRAIAAAEHPLVMFLDDLQWADAASFELLPRFMLAAHTRYFLLIGAYRENEVAAAHPLTVMAAELCQQQIPLLTIPVQNLSRAAVRDWLGDTLRGLHAAAPQELANLADLIYGKTRGNAFFTVQILTDLYKEQMLRFDFAAGRWVWDRARIAQLAITENVVDLLLRRIKALPRDVQEVLQRAACIGSSFDLSTLALIAETPHAAWRAGLDGALRENLLARRDAEHYQFGHDRIQQAAYALLGEDDKKQAHLKIGRLLQQAFPLFAVGLLSSPEKDLTPGPSPKERGDSLSFGEGWGGVKTTMLPRELNNSTLVAEPELAPAAGQQIFEVVRHVNLGRDLITDHAEQLASARLNLAAAQKAKAATAYRAGWDYAQQAQRFLTEADWRQEYALTLAVYQETVQLAYAAGEYAAMQQAGETVLQHAVSMADQALVYEYQIMSLIAQNQLEEALARALALFASLGVPIPRHPSEQETAALFAETQALLVEKGALGLQHLPRMQDAEKLAALRVYLPTSALLTFVAQELYPFVVNRMLAVSLRCGAAPETPYVLTEYGLLSVFQGELAAGYRFAQQAAVLAQAFAAREAMQVRMLTVSNIYTYPWQTPYPAVAAQFWDLHQRALRTGDVEYVGYALMYYVLLQRYLGIDLAVAEARAAAIQATLKPFGMPLSIVLVEIGRHVLANLQGKSPVPAQIPVDLEAAFPGPELETMRHTVGFYLNVSRLFLGYLFEEYFLADCTVELEKSPTESGVFDYSDLLLFSALMRLQLYATASKAEQRAYRQFVRNRLKTLAQWAELGPTNFQHRYFLLQAEFCRVTNKPNKAAEYYDRAIRSARTHGFRYVEALADELAAKFYMRRDRDELAEFYFQKAWQCYRQWGATAKVKHLEEHYPKYLRPAAALDSAATSSTSSLALDVRSILKATQTLSGEVQLKSLLEKMLHILLENAGAQRGVFIEQRDGQLLIQAEGAAAGVSGVLQAQPVTESAGVPLTLLNYAARRKQALVFDNLAKDPAYATDPYIRAHQPKSVVCAPVLKQDALAGLLYLENNLVEGAFTPARLEVLNILAAQIAISVENAELYENLEAKVRQRTAALQVAHAALAESHQALTDNVNYASRIQRAALPTAASLAELFPDHFLLYQPCAVVSGDFYWAQALAGKILLVVADCTGHGVSGGLVSMLGMALLNEVASLLAARGQLQADALLNELRDRVKLALKQQGSLWEQKDGMDMAVCLVDPANQRLQYAGANRPLYLVRGEQLREFPGDRMPVGIHRKERPFTRQEIPLERGDLVYLGTDGFVDQNSAAAAGGFGEKRLQQFLLEIRQEPPVLQKERLLRRFAEWQGELPQRDDLLLFGCRF